jgi:V8-like Glu-specific endopeptidase
MRTNRIVSGVAAVVAAAGLIGTGAALSNAASTPSPTTSTSAGSQAGPDGSAGSMNPNNDTSVTGTELASVTAAVKAKDSTVTVTSVRKDPDGSYDVFGTKSGATVMLEVSKDLKTITTGTGGHRGGGGHGGGNDTPVTGTELSTVTAAVKANDSTVTVTSVRKDPDGSYDVLGTRSGANVMLEVSKDLKTISTNAGGPRG